MRKEIFISIDNPCSEKWDSFVKTKNGGYCGHCKKNVIDFTEKTESDVYDYFSKHASSTCGRFKKTQLDRVYKNHSEGLSRAAILTAGFLAFINSKDAYSQWKRPKEKTEIANDNTNKKIISGTEKLFQIIGNINDDTSGLPGVNVIVKGTSFGTVTTANGDFELSYNGNMNDSITIVFSFIGFIDKERKVILNQEKIDINSIKLEIDETLSSEVILTGGICAIKKWSPRWMWYKIKGVFSGY